MAKVEKLILTYPLNDVPVVLLVVALFTKEDTQTQLTVVPRKDSTSTELSIPSQNATLKGVYTISRYLARKFQSVGLYGKDINDPLLTSEVDQWIDFAVGITSTSDLDSVASTLNTHLQVRSLLAGYKITLADIAIWSALKKSGEQVDAKLKETSKYPHFVRWFNYVEANPQINEVSQKQFSKATSAQKNDDKSNSNNANSGSRTGSQGSFSNLDLPNVKMGECVTRFPPEPSGFLHIGHAKAAFMNNYYANFYQGKLIIRFDDTNPSKEKDEYIHSILADLKTLGIQGAHVSYTSDFFPQLLEYAERLIKEGIAYADTTSVEEMRAERFDGKISKCRGNSVEENMRLWNEMKNGTEEGQKCVLRGKIDMESKNKCLRDPALVRVNTTPHHRTGTKYKVYPLYDFAVPIVDSIEGVTHALRSSEYHDRNPLYYWVVDTLKMRKPFIQDFSRLNFTYTLLSKRKLQWFVDSGIVPGWDDPRFPTVQGLLRRGLTVEALSEFILSQGASKSLNLMEIDKLWAVNKKIIDPIVPRYTALASQGKVSFILKDGPKTAEHKSIAKHKKNASLGNKVVTYTSTVFLEGEDAKNIKENEEVTLMDWGNAVADKITTDAQGNTTIEGHLNLKGDYKTTEKKLTWLPDISDNVKVSLIEFGFLITKKKLEEGDKLEDFVNRDSKKETVAFGDANLRTLAKGDRIQLERRGYFICDEPYLNNSKPIVLILIPDGHTTKATSTLTTPKSQQQQQ